ICVLLIATGAFAQSQATTGNIEGRVLDPKDAAVPGATIVAVNQETGLERTATSNDEGNFNIILLPPGNYTLRTNASGFSGGEVKDVAVHVGGRTPIDVRLSVGGASGQVTVTSEAPAIEATQSSVSATINSRA